MKSYRTSKSAKIGQKVPKSVKKCKKVVQKGSRNVKTIKRCQICGREKRIIFKKTPYFGYFGQNGQKVSDILMGFCQKFTKNHWFSAIIHSHFGNRGNLEAWWLAGWLDGWLVGAGWVAGLAGGMADGRGGWAAGRRSAWPGTTRRGTTVHHHGSTDPTAHHALGYHYPGPPPSSAHRTLRRGLKSMLADPFRNRILVELHFPLFGISRISTFRDFQDFPLFDFPFSSARNLRGPLGFRHPRSR